MIGYAAIFAAHLMFGAEGGRPPLEAALPQRVRVEIPKHRRKGTGTGNS